MPFLFENDLEHILRHTEKFWNELNNETILITGATGFIGRWLLESCLFAIRRFNLNTKIIIFTRNIEKAKSKFAEISELSLIEFREADVRCINSIYDEKISYIIHAATDASAKLNTENPIKMFDTIVLGTRNILNLAIHSKTRKFLFLSSGAVYGPVNVDRLKIPEDYRICQDITENGSAYSIGKAAAEYLCQTYGRMHPNLEIKIARCFAFVGAYLPLQTHFAIGNFIYNGLYNDTIQIKGDGTPIRSYMYAADLSIWLWTLLFEGKKNNTYNVGSEIGFSLAEIAEIVADLFLPKRNIKIAKKAVKSKRAESYVPSTQKIRNELGVKEWIDLENSIKRTIAWYRKENVLAQTTPFCMQK